MLCGLCGGRPTDLPHRIRRSFRKKSWELERLTGLFCDRCGGALPTADTTELLLAKLTQLARFGLTADGRVLLPTLGRDA